MNRVIIILEFETQESPRDDIDLQPEEKEWWQNERDEMFDDYD